MEPVGVVRPVVPVVEHDVRLGRARVVVVAVAVAFARVHRVGRDEAPQKFAAVALDRDVLDLVGDEDVDAELDREERVPSPEFLSLKPAFEDGAKSLSLSTSFWCAS